MRRWAKAASTTANTASRPARLGGGSRRVSATSPLSTFGGGQNTARPTEPARWTSAYQAAFTLGTPYVRDPGGGGQPVGDLGLHHDQAEAQAGQPLRAA